MPVAPPVARVAGPLLDDPRTPPAQLPAQPLASSGASPTAASGAPASSATPTAQDLAAQGAHTDDLAMSTAALQTALPIPAPLQAVAAGQPTAATPASTSEAAGSDVRAASAGLRQDAPAAPAAGLLAPGASVASTTPLQPAPVAPLASDAAQPSFAQRIAAASVSAPAARIASAPRSVATAAIDDGAATAKADPAAPAATVGAVTAAAVTAISDRLAQGNGGDGSPAGDQATASPTPGVGTQPAAEAAAMAPPLAAAGVADTVASFAATLVQRLGQRVSRFQVVLNPEGLGKVDVAVKIAADGALSARIACAKDGGADALKARTGELAASLQQAGFSIAADALRIDAPPPAAIAPGSLFAGTDPSGGGAQDRGAPPAAWRTPAPPLDAGIDAISAAYATAGRTRGLDIRI